MNKRLQLYWPIVLIGILLLGFLFRFYRLDWDEGYYLHPDERLYINAAEIHWPTSWAQFWEPESPLNPHMFYYGPFPLYLYKTIFTLVTSLQSAQSAVGSLLFTSRMVSAVVNVFSVVILFLLTRRFFNRRVAFIATGLLALFPGAIQAAHYNTTESFLLFFGVALLYCAFRIYHKPSLPWLLLSALLVGMATSTKIVGISYAVLPVFGLLPHVYRNLKQKKWDQILRWSGWYIVFGLVLVVAYFGLSPYTYIAKSEFTQQQDYMQSVIKGENKPPFVIIYEHTLPYWHFIQGVLPWQTSFLLAPITLVAWGYVVWMLLKKRQYQYFLLLLWPTAYFAVIGLWYAKFSRYFTPLLPFLAIFSGLMFDELSKQAKRHWADVVIGGVLGIQIIAAIGFMNVYRDRNTRIRASEWIFEHTSPNDVILGEHWDDPLPLLLRGQTSTRMVETIASYDPESSQKWSVIAGQLASADYIVLSSRRVYVSIQRNPQLYPQTIAFYHKLFSGQLGYTQIESFTSYPTFLGWTLNDDAADESFQSYDHPPVLIFKKTVDMTPSQMLPLLQSKVRS